MLVLSDGGWGCPALCTWEVGKVSRKCLRFQFDVPQDNEEREGGVGVNALTTFVDVEVVDHIRVLVDGNPAAAATAAVLAMGCSRAPPSSSDAPAPAPAPAAAAVAQSNAVPANNSPKGRRNRRA